MTSTNREARLLNTPETANQGKASDRLRVVSAHAVPGRPIRQEATRPRTRKGSTSASNRPTGAWIDGVGSHPHVLYMVPAEPLARPR